MTISSVRSVRWGEEHDMKMKITWYVVALVALQVVVTLPCAVGAPIAPNAEQPQCSDQVSCSTCSSQPGCGWCAYLFECLPGTVNGSTSGSCTDTWTLWYFEPHSCPAESPFPSLCTSKPCSECVSAGYCGWCGSSCIPGTESSPYYGSCPVWYFSHCAIVTARNVWWLWAMFAFLLLSILVSALGICFFKRCRAIINGTPVSGEHTPPVYQTKLYMSANSSEMEDTEQIPLDN